MIFDIVELIDFFLVLIAFIFILSTYLKLEKEKLSSNVWFYFLSGSGFLLLNRIFTNIEALGMPNLFNFLEHLSIFAAACAFLFVTIKQNSKKQK